MQRVVEEVDEQRLGVRPDYLFDAAAWPRQLGAADAGRGATAFVGDTSGDYALRTYRRGGAMASLLGDRYLFTGASRVRSLVEYRLLKDMYESGLPVPAPAAARCEREGLFYRAWLVTALIPETKTLTEALARSELAEDAWGALGDTLARFHRAGIDHPDLNANNILLQDGGQWFLLDFDRGRKRSPGSWSSGNLKRLYRSLLKERTVSGATHWDERHWHALASGYRSAYRSG
ncbi:MAG: 3-deoxy-D-manno-octulosonic acid kinase [Pseudomonadota bacterium]